MSYGRPTTSDIRQSSQIPSNRRDLNGDGLDISAERSAALTWTESSENIIISGSSDLTRLTGLRGAILKLK
jgi:hypothetical protein